MRLDCVARLAVFELPFVVDATRAPIPREFAARLGELIAADRRGEAVRLLHDRGGRAAAGARSATMRIMPMWSKLKALAHTLPYDAAILGQDTGGGHPLPPSAGPGSACRRS